MERPEPSHIRERRELVADGDLFVYLDRRGRRDPIV